MGKRIFHADWKGVAALVLWAFTATIISWSGKVPPLFLLALSLSLTLLVYFSSQFFYQKDPWRDFRMSPLAYVFGILSHGGYLACFYLGLKFAPIAEANLLNYLWPILFMILSCIDHRSWPKISQGIGMLVAFIGVVFLFSHGVGLKYDLKYWQGYAFAALGAVIWANYSTFTKRFNFTHGNVNVFFLFSALIALCLSLIFEKQVWPIGWEWGIVVLLGISRLSFMLWDAAMKEGDHRMLSSLAYFVPLFSTLLLVCFGKGVRQEINSRFWIAALLVIGGCLAVNYTMLRNVSSRQAEQAERKADKVDIA